MVEHSRQIEFGSRQGYDWLFSEATLYDLLQVCPDVVLGKYVAVTSFDSGSLSLSQEEQAAGWRAHNGIAYSPKIECLEMLPRDQYDEWYVFTNPVDLGELVPADRNIFECQIQPGQVHAFVNYGGFVLHPDYAALTQLLWQQLGWIQPESYIADGEFLSFVSKQKQLFASAHAALGRRANGSRS
jgi:hypothetical protein